MYLCRKIIGTSLNNIGVYFGGRDHSTVIHAVKTINDKINNKKHIKEQIEAVKQELDFSLM
jgi:chromosomal replication initiator protein